MISAVNRKKTPGMKTRLLGGVLLCIMLYILGAFFADTGIFGIPEGWLLYGQDILIGILVNLAITLVFSDEKKRLKLLKLLFPAAALTEILICLWLHFSPPLGKLPLESIGAQLLGNAVSAVLILSFGRFTREKASF